MKDKVAFVTGAGSGIGRAAAELLAREGVRVALVGRTEDELRPVEQGIRRAGGAALTVVCDIARAEDVERGIGQTLDRWGRLDMVFANAGINGAWAPIDRLTPEEWDLVMDINLKGTYLTIHFAVPHLREHGGSIVITSSVNGTRMFSNVSASAYATTKAGQVALAKMLALELSQNKIRVNVICPGAITTNIEESTDKSKFW